MAGIGGAVVIAVLDALGLVILEEGPVLIAADEAVAPLYPVTVTVPAA